MEVWSPAIVEAGRDLLQAQSDSGC
jgi:hypothetical protein